MQRSLGLQDCLLCLLSIALLSLVVLTLSFPSVAAVEDLDKYKPGVVKITATVEGRQKTGTGFIIQLDTGSALVLTASHVVAGDPTPQVEFFTEQGTRRRAEVRNIESDDPRGVALLIVRGDLPSGLVALALGPSIAVKGGDAVTAIGFPQSGGPWAISNGTVSARKGRDLILAGAIDEGSSGGPLLKDGKVVGIVTGLLNQFVRAIPASVVKITLEGWQEVLEEDIAATPNTPLAPRLAGTTIAYQGLDGDDNRKRIYLMNADASNRRPLINDSNRGQVPINCHDGKLPDMEAPSWSADGTKLAFQVTVWDDQPGKCGSSGYSQIMTIDANGSRMRQLTGGRVDNIDPVWSHDGTKIAFASRDEHADFGIVIMNNDGSAPLRLTGKSDTNPAWSPTAAKIAFKSRRGGDYAIYVMNADGTGQRRLTKSFYYIGDLSWSPDGKQLAFTLNREEGKRAQIYVIEVEGSGVRRLTDSNEDTWIRSPTWSPDGARIAYISSTYGRRSRIYLVNPDGSDPSLLSDDLENNPERLAWSPFSKK